MKILFLTTHLNTGGITSYLYTLARGLLGNGHDIFVVSSGGDRESSFEELGAKVTTLNIRTKSELSWKVYAALKPIAKIVKENNIDIVHSQTRITQVIGWWLSILTKAQMVSTCHGFFKPRLSRKVFQCWGERVVAISSQVVEHLKNDLNVKEEKISLVENGIDLDDFSWDDKSVRTFKRKEFGFTDEFVIGIIARLSDVKGQDILISAMKTVAERIPHAKLLIVGQGKTEEMLKEMADELGLKNHIIFHPIIHQTAEILPAFDVFVMPSRMEGLGLSVMEAQAAGIPVVASRVGGIPSLIKDGETGYLVEPEDSQSLAEAIVAVFQNPEESKAVGLKGRVFAEKTFSSEKMVKKTTDIYQSVLKGNDL